MPRLIAGHGVLNVEENDLCPVLPSMIPTRYIPIINLFNVLEL